ncbi:MAG TPA: hypothetical protein VGR21_03295 [Cryptosporangiaceae bacterium]|nr:hypothetical protein [Cryptosporangiaceae bacterium]
MSGSPPEGMLYRPVLTRVAGDNEAGFYRPHPAYGGETGPAGVRLEAYSWGKLTSGAAARAFWLLLLPFMLVNVAPFMRPAKAAPHDGPVFRFVDRLLLNLNRTLALTLTGTLILAVAGVGLDLAAWQCAGSRCGESRWYLSFLSRDALSGPGVRLAFGAAVPLAVVLFLWYLGKRTWARYEAYPAGVERASGDLTDGGFWYGRHAVGRLRAVHVASGLATVAALVAWPLYTHDREPGGAAWLPSAGLVLFVAAAAVLVISVVAMWVPVVADREAEAPRVTVAGDALRTVALVLVALVLAYAAWARPDWASNGSLPGYSGTVTVVFLAQFGLLLAIAGTLAVLRRYRAEGCAPAFAGFGPVVVGALALFLACALAAGMAYRVGSLLDDRTVPRSYAWAAFGFTFAVAAIVVVTVGLVPVVRRRLAAAARGDVIEDLGPPPAPGQPGHRRFRQVQAAIANARLTDRAPLLVTVVFVPGVLMAAAVSVVVALGNPDPRLFFGEAGWSATAVDWITTVGTWLIGLSAFGLLWLGIQTYRNQGYRRLVGIVWDLGTFWPRDAHPLAPPCYAERVVPELVQRLTWLSGVPLHEPLPPVAPTGAGDLAVPRAGVVLSGHSQGSVLAAAAMLQLTEEIRARVAMLTYGSPLRRLYARYFPAYFGDRCLDAVRDKLTPTDGPGRWTNLWRRTDPIGGWVQSSRPGGMDIRFVDPLLVDIPPWDTTTPPIYGHSDYQEDPAYDRALAGLVRSLPPRRAPDPAEAVVTSGDDWVLSDAAAARFYRAGVAVGTPVAWLRRAFGTVRAKLPG